MISKENGGHGSTINRGIQEAKGKYFKVVDGDDWVDSNGFQNFVRCWKGVTQILLLQIIMKSTTIKRKNRKNISTA